jgi:hypothetical protein
MDGRDDGRAHQTAVGERKEVESVVDQVELVGSLEHRRDVEALGHLGVDVCVFRPARRYHRREPCRGLGIT